MKYIHTHFSVQFTIHFQGKRRKSSLPAETRESNTVITNLGAAGEGERQEEEEEEEEEVAPV